MRRKISLQNEKWGQEVVILLGVANDFKIKRVTKSTYISNLITFSFSKENLLYILAKVNPTKLR